MSALKELVRAIIAIIVGYLLYWFWATQRAMDPDYYKYGAGILAAVLVFVLLHFLGKEG